MPYTPEHRVKTRRRILDAARNEMNRKGYGAASIDSIMAEAGLTRGGFYAHFDCKEDLFVEVLKDFAATPIRTGGAHPPVDLACFIDRYLSTAHRDRTDAGCSVPPLSSDIARASDKTKSVFSEFVESAARKLANLDGTDGPDAEERALAVLATCVGGLALSRAVAEDSLSERILTACRDGARRAAMPNGEPG